MQNTNGRCQRRSTPQAVSVTEMSQSERTTPQITLFKGAHRNLNEILDKLEALKAIAEEEE
jgi:hypothetical protein